MVSVTKLAREVENAKARRVLPSYRQIRCKLGAMSTKALGIETAETETVADRRTGWPEERIKLAWLPRSQVRIVEGRMEPGAVVSIELPEWLAKRNPGIFEIEAEQGGDNAGK